VTRYLLDTNHLSAYLDRNSVLEARVDARLLAGNRFGITLPVLCEYRAGIAAGSRFQPVTFAKQWIVGRNRLPTPSVCLAPLATSSEV